MIINNYTPFSRLCIVSPQSKLIRNDIRYPNPRATDGNIYISQTINNNADNEKKEKIYKATRFIRN